MTVRRPFLDFEIAILLVLAASFVSLGSLDARLTRTPRRLSHAAMQARIGRIPTDVGVNLVLLGDSRTIPIDADALCRNRTPSPTSCLNAATTGGDWFSAHAKP
jgi:hypothetical protein